MLRRAIDRLVGLIARLVVLGFFRSVQEWGGERIPRDRPVLLVVNHFNGFVDPVLVARLLGRLPRFLAKSTLWKLLPLRPLLALAGVIPVFRQADTTDRSGNVRSFEQAEAALLDGGTVCIFPEGTTHDEPRLAPIRTGAARIALGAWGRGCERLAVVPLGLAFDDKVALRSRAFARVGQPILLEEVVPDLAGDRPVDETDRAAVRALTTRLSEGLQAVAPDFDSAYERGGLQRAAELLLRDPGADGGEEVSFADREALAARLGATPPAARARVLRAVADYQLELDVAGVRDRELVAGFQPRRLLERLVLTAVVGFVLLTFAAVGVLANAVPAALVALAGRSVAAPVTKGTVRVLTAAIAFPVGWAVVAWLTVDGLWAILFAMAVFAVTGLVAVRGVELALGLVRHLDAWQLLQDRRGLLGEARARRAEAVDAVRQELVG